MTTTKNRLVKRKHLKKTMAVMFMSIIVIYYSLLRRFSIVDDELDFVPEELRKYTDPFNRTGRPHSELGLEFIRRQVFYHNKNTVVLNTQAFGFMSADTNILAVQVHRDVEHLRYLIVSLGLVGNIDTALVVFSHSHYDVEIVELVQSITFCRVLQIFYPHSPLCFPSGFPGPDEADCQLQAGDPSCRRRDPQRVLHKHHWWWKANWIFDWLPWSRGYTGYVVFLEEDDLVAPDVLYVLDYLKEATSSYFPDEVELIAFGGPSTDRDDYNHAMKEDWSPSYERGLTLDKVTWETIRALGEYYCKYDDCSWSRSLLHLFRKRKTDLVKMLAMKAPRVVGSNLRGFKASVAAAARAVYRVWNAGRLFPNVRDMVFSVRWEGDEPQGGGGGGGGAGSGGGAGGGWADERDVRLCLATVNVTKQLLNSNKNTRPYDSVKVPPNNRIKM